MKITLFTSNHNRHNYLVNLMSDISEQLFVIQENKTTFPGTVPGHYPASNIMKKYFSNVTKAQTKMFGNSYVDSKNLLNIVFFSFVVSILFTLTHPLL